MVRQRARQQLILFPLFLIGAVVAAILPEAFAEPLPQGMPSGLSQEKTPQLELPEDLKLEPMEPAAGEPVSIEEVSKLAVANNLNISVYRLDRAAKREEAKIAHSVYQTDVTVAAAYEIDEAQPASTILGSRAVTGSLTSAVETKLPSGTDLTLTHTAGRSSTQSPFATLSRHYTSSLEVAAVQPILQNSFGIIDRAKVEQVELDVERFDYETADRIEAEVAAVRAAYWEFIFAQRDRSAKEQALEQAQEFFRTTQSKLTFGMVEKQDVYAAEANVRLRMVDTLEVRATLANRQEALEVLLDLPEGAHVVPSTDPDFVEIEVDEAISLERALRQRRDLKQAKLDLEIGALEVRMKKSGLLPQLDLEGRYRSNGLDRELWSSQGEIGGLNHPTIYAGVTYSQPFENLDAKAEFRQATFGQEQARLLLKQIQRRIEQEVHAAVREVRLAAARVHQTTQAESLQRNKLLEEGKAFQFGRSDSRTVIDFQEDVIASQAQAARALVDYHKAVDGLHRVENQLLESAGLLDESG